MYKFREIIPILILLCLSYWAVKPLFMAGFFPMHDNTQVARVFEMSKAIGDGMFPVRWVADLGYGYGYPIFNFYGPMAYYIGGIFQLTGFDALTATKLMFGFGIIFSGITMYLLAREFWGKTGGVVAGLFYLYAPYHAVDIYVRGDVAEFFAYSFIPLAFYGIWKVYQNPKWRYVIIGSIGFSGIILSHNLTGMMVTPFLFLALLVLCFKACKANQKKILYLLGATLLLGVLLSGFYFLPALSEIKYTNVLSQIGGSADFHEHFVCLTQLWNSPWGYGGSGPGCIDGLSFRIGKLAILLSVLSLFFIPFIFQKDKVKFSVSLFAIILLIVSIFLTLDVSRSFWELVKPMAFLQYPWRFLILISFASSFLTGFTTWFMGFIFKQFRSTSLAVAVVLIFGVIYMQAKLFVPQKILLKSVNDYTSLQAVRWDASRLTDEYLPIGFTKPKTIHDIPVQRVVMKNGKILSISEKTQRISVQTEDKNEVVVHFNLAVYPSWQFFLDRQKIVPDETNFGYDVSLPRGIHTIEAEFIQTPVEKMGNLLSITGIVGILTGIIIERKKRNTYGKTS